MQGNGQMSRPTNAFQYVLLPVVVLCGSILQPLTHGRALRIETSDSEGIGDARRTLPRLAEESIGRKPDQCRDVSLRNHLVPTYDLETRPDWLVQLNVVGPPGAATWYPYVGHVVVQRTPCANTAARGNWAYPQTMTAHEAVSNPDRLHLLGAFDQRSAC